MKPPAIPFFPSTFPGETLHSRVSRYHIISGNSTYNSTIIELFQLTQIALSQVVPPGIDVLAARLPGTATQNLKTIIQENTLLPLFLPFIGRTEVSESAASDKWLRGMMSRVPRRVVGKHGDSFLCTSCLHEDEQQHGVAYWHREHQAPGVAVCWKHGTPLMSSCPQCSYPFQFRNKPLSAPWMPCRCGHDLQGVSLERSSSDLDHRYANFVRDLIQAQPAPINPDLLAQTYRTKIRERGYARGSQVNLGAFTEVIVAELGEEFVSRVDPAFSAKRTVFWLRFHTVDAAMDMPITRHILLSMYLFGSVAQMMQAVQEQATTRNQSTSLPKSSSRLREGVDHIRNEHRRRVLLEKKRDPAIRMEGLWKKALRSTEWLFDNDKRWLDKVMSGQLENKVRKKAAQVDVDEKQDESFANMIEQQARSLLEARGKPRRVTQERLLECLPKKIILSQDMKDKYPLLFARMEQYRETSWCFGARRILWSIGEITKNEQAITPGNIRSASRVGHHAVIQILDFTKWDCLAMAGTRLHIPTELAKVGISLTWRGPEVSTMAEIAGRKYVRRRPERSNSNIDVVAGHIPSTETADTVAL